VPEFDCVVPRVDEGTIRFPEDLLVTARRKAAACSPAAGEQLVLAADTGVFVQGRHLGKPTDRSQAAEMLRMLSGRWHVVYTAVCLRAPGNVREAVVETGVRFHSLSDEEISWCLSGEDVMDKAGAYAIQGRAAAFVERIEGEYTNVVGLPLGVVYRMLRELDWRPGVAGASRTEGG